ncbi:MAG: hypothetical protein KIT34_12825 [Cyanobacteria bacterium TGS_CYA1]|nr:hypothetical protein [Cyanobacteria bacterium TGS_CYA1]
MDDKKCCDAYWIKQLAQSSQAQHEAEQRAWMEKHSQNDRDVSEWMDHLFENMISFSDQFDQMTSDISQQIEWETPAFHHVDCNDILQESDRPPGDKVYAGHLTFSDWSMMMRGYSHEIQIFIIPSNMLLQLSVGSFDSRTYPPLVRIKFHPDSTEKAHLKYHEGSESLDKEINSHALPELAKAFFSALVDKKRQN